MGGIELEFDYACDSASTIIDIRNALKTKCDASDLAKLAIRVDEICKQTPEKYLPSSWRVAKVALQVLACHAICVEVAKGADGNIVSEQAKLNVLIGEFRSELTSGLFIHSSLLEKIHQDLNSSTDQAVDSIHHFLSHTPLPTLYLTLKDEPFPALEQDEIQHIQPVPLVYVIAFLDHAPLATPQYVKSKLLYSIIFKIRGVVWPEDAKSLRLDLLTTCPSNEYSVSEFLLEHKTPTDNIEFKGEVSGHIKFNSAQSSLLDNLIFGVRAAFEMLNGDFQEVPVIGHHELRLRVTDQQQHPLMSWNSRLDQHVEHILTQLLQICPNVKDELEDLFPVLQALTSLLATYAQEAIYKGRSNVRESEFQSTVLRDLRFKLGQDVQEHPRQAGGITDIKYRGVIVELKVETKDGNRDHICRKYSMQSTQYAGVEARQVSVVLVLDLSSKDNPPGDIRNDILLTDVKTHGTSSDSTTYPSKAFVFVVNGNMKSPSEYSR